MNQEGSFVSPPETTPAVGDHCGCPAPPKRVVRRFVRTKIPKLTVSLQLSLISQKPKKKPIDYVLTRLAGMDLPGKAHGAESGTLF